MTSTSGWLPQLLKEQSFLQSHAFWNGNFHNHKPHSVIALARIGASEERIRKHCQWQDDKSGIITFAKEPDLQQETEVDSIKSDNINDYLGKNVGYYKILNHFTKLLETKYNKDVNNFIRGELPELIDGQLGSLFHGIIHLGYGFAAKSDQVVLEGVAFSLEQFALVKSSSNPERARDISRFGTGTTDLLDILKDVRENKKDEWTSISRSVTLAEKYGDLFLDYADSVKLPDWFDSVKEEINQAIKLMEWFRDMAAVLFVEAEFVNDFFLLHGVTGAWSFLQVLHLMDYKTAILAIRAYLVALLVVYARIGTPRLIKKPDDYWTGEIDQAAWDKILKDTVAEEYENHIFKVVQCLYEAWKNNTDCGMAKYYIAGSRMALDNDLYFYSMGAAFSRFAGKHSWTK